MGPCRIERQLLNSQGSKKEILVYCIAGYAELPNVRGPCPTS